MMEEPHDYQSWPTHARHYKREVTDIIACLREDRPFRTSFRDGLHVAGYGGRVCIG